MTNTSIGWRATRSSDDICEGALITLEKKEKVIDWVHIHGPNWSNHNPGEAGKIAGWEKAHPELDTHYVCGGCGEKFPHHQILDTDDGGYVCRPCEDGGVIEKNRKKYQAEHAAWYARHFGEDRRG